MAKKNDTPTLVDVVADVTDAQAKKRIKAFETGFDNRAAHENLVAGGNTSIQDKIKAVRKRFEVPGIAALSVATNVDADFMNRSVSGDKRYNIYAIQKLADLLHGLNSGTLKNQINVAVLKSMLACEKAGVPFGGQTVLAAASDKIKVGKDLDAILTRHTVSASTAPTQSSSTMNALQTLGVVKNVGTTRAPVFEFTQSPQTEAVRTMMA